MTFNHLPNKSISLLFLIFTVFLISLPASCVECYSPFKKSLDNSTCIKPCPENQFYYRTEDLCKDHCPRQGRSWIALGVKICDLPCQFNQVYLPSDDSDECFGECPSGFKLEVIDTISQCVRICPKNQFYSEVGDSQCQNECHLLEVNAHDAKICKFPCEKNEFWNPGTSECSSECLAPFVREPVADVFLCKYPCQNGEFWDPEAKTCNKTCSFPHSVQIGHLGFQSCEKPCNSSDLHFIKEQNQCEKECPEFWTPKTVNGIKICKLSCPKDYFYNNEKKTCQDSCPWPFEISQDPVTQAKFCNPPCKSDEVLMNSRCVKECPYPWESQTLHGITFCAEPCKAFQFWDHESRSCRNSCPPYMIQQEINKISSCTARCSQNQYYNSIDQKCYSSCPEPLVPDLSDGINTCHHPCRKGEAYNSKTKTCVRNCPPLTRKQSQDNIEICAPYCPKGMIFSPYGCVRTCEKPSVLVEEDGIEICQFECPEGLLMLNPFKECVASCPKTHEKQVQEKMNKYLQRENVEVCEPRCEILVPFKLESEDCFWSADTDWTFSKGRAIGNCPQEDVLELHLGFPTCRKPCQDGEYWNEVTLTCEESCPGPWKSRVMNNNTQICFKPCEDSEFYLVEMQMCLPSCPSLWINETVDGINLCKQPCGPSDFFYPENKTCSSFCPKSWVRDFETQDYIRICQKPCGPGEFRFQNRTCGPVCPKYWAQTVKDEIYYCHEPCLGNDNIWLEKEKRCVRWCPPEGELIEKNGVKVCIERCEKGEKWSKEEKKCMNIYSGLIYKE